MRINNNIMAMNTHRQYAINNDNMAKATEKLSSGLKINRAGDDAAGLAISEKMRSQIRGLNMASKNSQDAISLVQTAEGALTETHSILQRMNELATQSASDTNDDTTDRSALDAEFQQLKAEIDDIANKTAFNGKKLLDGTYGSASTSTTNITSAVTITAGSTAVAGTTNLSISNFQAAAAAGAGTATAAVSGAVVTAASITAQPTVTGTASNGTYYLQATDEGAGDISYQLMDSSGTQVATTSAAAFATGAVSLDFGTYGTASITIAGGTANAAAVAAVLDGSTSSEASITIAGATDAQALSFDIGAATFTAASTSGAVATGVTMDLSSVFAGITTQTSAEDAIFGTGLTSGSVTVTAGNSMTVQTGANQGDTLALSIDSMTSASLGLTASAVSNQTNAATTITTVHDAINSVSAQRAALGATQNRLEHKINNLNASSENLSAAESRIRDVDMAQEMTEYTQTSILVQAATSMLAQANAAPQNVLSLLQ